MARRRDALTARRRGARTARRPARVDLRHRFPGPHRGDSAAVHPTTVRLRAAAAFPLREQGGESCQAGTCRLDRPRHPLRVVRASEGSARSARTELQGAALPLLLLRTLRPAPLCLRPRPRRARDLAVVPVQALRVRSVQADRDGDLRRVGILSSRALVSWRRASPNRLRASPTSPSTRRGTASTRGAARCRTPS